MRTWICCLLNNSNSALVPAHVLSSATVQSNTLGLLVRSPLQLCLLAKCFKPALPFLEMDMMDICKENGAYDAKHFLCYYYYGGMIYTGLKNFERALYFYEQVLPRLSTAQHKPCIWTGLLNARHLPPSSLWFCKWLHVYHFLLAGNNHSSHGSEPHHVGSL